MSARDHKLDFVKGFLVFAMVVYHTMNYFSDVPAQVYGYLRFVNGAFVFISGYVIALYYRPTVDRDVWALWRRLETRGLKLLLIFTTLNIVISVLGLTSYRSVQFGLGRFLSDLAGIYLRGDSMSMAFRILLPIAYVLLLAPLTLLVRRGRKPLAILGVLGAFLYSWFGGDWPNVYFLLIGLLGLVAGNVIAYADIYPIKNWTILALLFVALAAAMNFLSGNVAAYSFGILVVLKVVYDWADTIDRSSWFTRIMVSAGQYSLVAYIGQIAFLNVLRLVLPSTDARISVFSAALLATALLMILLPVAVSRMRSRFRVVDRLYRFAFA